MTREEPTGRQRVLAIIVSYKTARLVTGALRSLEAERRRDPGLALRAVVVDNSGEDAAPVQQFAEQQGWDGWVDVLRAPRNGGFAYGNNLGFRHGYEQPSAPDYFFLLNPDAEVRPGAVRALVDFLRKTPAAGAAGPQIEQADGSPWNFAMRFPSLLGELEHALRLGPVSELLDAYKVLQPMGDRPRRVDWLSGCALMLKRELIDHVGGMDESYFLYYEETDFLRKAQRAGWQAWHVPQSRVVHIAGQSTQVTNQKDTLARHPPYWFESRRRYFVKNHGWRYAAAADAVSVAAGVAARLRSALRGRSHEHVPQLERDILAHSPLWPKNRDLAAPQEFAPGRVREG